MKDKGDGYAVWRRRVVYFNPPRAGSEGAGSINDEEMEV